jgi:hypothetical protein
MGNHAPTHTVAPTERVRPQHMEIKLANAKRERKEKTILKAIVKLFLDEKFQLSAIAGRTHTGITPCRDVLRDVLFSMPESKLCIHKGGAQIGTVFFNIGRGDGTEIIEDVTDSVQDLLQPIYQKFDLKVTA